MNNKIFRIIFLVSIILSVGCARGWKNYVSREGLFSVRFPDKPATHKIILDTKYGQNYLNEAIVTKDKFVYAVSYIDYPDQAFVDKTVEQILNDAQSGTAVNTAGKLLDSRDISIGKYPGKEFTIEAAGGKVIVKMRLYLVNHRLYQLSVAMPPDKSSSGNINKFFNSFAIYKK